METLEFGGIFFVVVECSLECASNESMLVMVGYYIVVDFVGSGVVDFILFVRYFLARIMAHG